MTNTVQFSAEQTLRFSLLPNSVCYLSIIVNNVQLICLIIEKNTQTNKQTVQYSTVQYNIVQYSTVQYSTVQYSRDCGTDWPPAKSRTVQSVCASGLTRRHESLLPARWQEQTGRGQA